MTSLARWWCYGDLTSTPPFHFTYKKQNFMNTIPKVMTQARTAETSDLSAKLVYAGKQAELNEDDPIQVILKDLEGVNSKAIIALKKDKAQSDLDEYDARRDSAYRSLLYLCKGFTHHPDEAVQASALAVEEVMDKYGFDLVSAGYSAESALIDSLMADLKKPELAPKMELLPGFIGLTDQLKQAQEGFKQAEYTYLQAREKEHDVPVASHLKKDLMSIINTQLVVYLRGMMVAQPDQYKSLASQVAMLIGETNSIIKQRRSNGN